MGSFPFKRKSAVWLLSDALILVLLVLSLSPAGAEAASDRRDPSRKKTVNFVYFPMAVPVAVLGETVKRDRVLQRALERAGCGIRFTTLPKGIEILPLVRNNEVDATIISDMPGIEATTIGDGLIAGTVKRSFSSVVARNQTLLGNLRRKKIGNVFGSTSHYALLQALAAANLTESDVSIVEMELTRMPDALAEGKIDAFAAWEPVPTAAMKKYPGRFAVIHRQVSLGFFLLSERLLRENPAAADAVSASLIRAVRWLKKGKNLEKASSWALAGMTSFSGKPSPLSVFDIADITRSDLLEVPAAPMIAAAEKEGGGALSRAFDFLEAIGKLPPQASREKFLQRIRPDLLPRLLADRTRYRLNTFDYAP